MKIVFLLISLVTQSCISAPVDKGYDLGIDYSKFVKTKEILRLLKEKELYFIPVLSRNHKSLIGLTQNPCIYKNLSTFDIASLCKIKGLKFLSLYQGDLPDLLANNLKAEMLAKYDVRLTFTKSPVNPKCKIKQDKL